MGISLERRPAAASTRHESAKGRGFSLPLGTRTLARGAFAPLMYNLGRTRAMGVLDLFVPGGTVETLPIHRGCLAPPPGSPAASAAARTLARLASIQGLRYRFRASAVPAPTAASGPPCHLAAWARAHLEAQLDTGRARRMVAELAGTRLAVAHHNAPDTSLCDQVDRRILAAMEPPRPLHEIWPLSRTSRFRLLAFLHFLRAVGALRLLDQPADSPGATAAAPDAALPAGATTDQARRLLGVSRDSDADTLRRAYHRRARTLHPDLHPEASDVHRRMLERELAALTRAYDQTRGRPGSGEV